jgi:hypothetical protein
MILGFKPQFKYPILIGAKIHTIREDKHNRWQAGNTIQMATGVRTKNYYCFKQKRCRSVQYICMTYIQGRFQVSVGDDEDCDKFLHRYDVIELSINDGFDNVLQFEKWFIPLIDASPNKIFTGKIIHWTNFKY